MQLEFAVTVANTNANAAKHCPNRKNIFFMYTPLSICQLYNTIKQYHKIRVLHPILLNLIYVNVEI